MAHSPRRLWHRLWHRVAWEARDEDMQQEMQFHVDSVMREFMRSGMPEREARLAARRRFGSVAQMKERGHDVRGAGALEDVLREGRYAARRLARAPSFALAAAATLAVAIGANVAMFAVVHRVIVSPLPYPDSDRLLQLEHGIARINVPSGIGMTSGLYYQYLDRARTLEAIALYRTGESTLTGSGEPERIRVAHATTTLATVLKVQPFVGRWFTDGEDTPGSRMAVVLSHALWMRRFSGAPSVLGRSIVLDGAAADVVGVMPATFTFPDRVDMWVAEQLSQTNGFGLPFGYVGIARMRTGATVAGVRADLDTLIADLPNVYPGDPGVIGNVGEGGLRSAAITLKEVTVGNVADVLWVLLAAAAVVLLVACANVANLFLVRSESRQREVAVRRALGASGPALARFFFAESVLLSFSGGAVGVALAFAGVRLAVRFGPANLPRLNEVHLDGTAIAFALGLSAAVAVVFGSIPLWRHAPVAASLREVGRATASAGRIRTRHVLMGAQVAMALVLLVASGLMIRSFQQLRAVDPGFDASSALTFRIGLPQDGYPTREAAAAAHSAILDRVSALPGVTAASAATALPLAGGCFGNTFVAQDVQFGDGGSRPVAVFCAVAGGYADAMRMHLRRGRGLGRDDVERRLPNAVVNQAFVDIVFPDADPIGRRVRSNAPPPSGARRDARGAWTWDGAPNWLTIVGVVSNTPRRALGESDVMPVVFLPMSLAGGPDIPALAMLGPDVSVMSYVMRTSTSPLGLLPSVRSAIGSVDSRLAVADVQTLQQVLDRGSAQMAFTMVLITSASVAALLLGVIGVYGVISYIVTQRIGEIGVRLALGAEPRSVARMIIRQGAAVALSGIAVGVAIALAGGRLIEALLYDVSPRDPGVFSSIAVGVLGVVLFACWLPAHRAARINPAQLLRAE